MKFRLLLILPLVLTLAAFSCIAGEQILLLHGWHGSGDNWDEVKQVLTDPPYSFDPNDIFAPTLPDTVSLATWAGNIASYIDSMPAGGKITVVAHSFAGPSTLLLLIAARHMESGDYSAWLTFLTKTAPELSRIASELSSVTDKDSWMKAAKRIGKLFLYHPALGGGCFACDACGGIPLPFVCDAAVRDMCALATGKEILFSREEIEHLPVQIVDIYATRSGCAGNCLGAEDTDGFVSETEQRLFFTAPNYHEIRGKSHCHIDFIIDRTAAADMCAIMFPAPAPQGSEI